MGDLIILLQLIQKLNNGKLILDSQVEYIAQELTGKLNQILDPDAELLLNCALQQINGNESNSLFIDLY